MNQLMLTATEGGYVGANTLIKESVRIVTKSNTVATQTYDKVQLENKTKGQKYVKANISSTFKKEH